ncbi:hypothetical protein HFP15_15150 [Amycolatopsis sp. K13G38]|uniref:SDR family NAD(P)-dependent oxidoreductase n=1 Tax=Amycolatopsis acididurans TaxID=2724524 RepID=A0ABX1J3I7_9PSEU|nr:hypothetical protein [Amycolatopsis acididurans]NKQ54224.1 hypothetical protein [Amycolatopsis acididurans]
MRAREPGGHVVAVAGTARGIGLTVAKAAEPCASGQYAMTRHTPDVGFSLRDNVHRWLGGQSPTPGPGRVRREIPLPEKGSSMFFWREGNAGW